MAVAFDAVGPAGGLGATTAGAGPLTWAHINSAAGNAICVGVNYRSGTTPEATAVTYGGVSLARIGTVPGNNVGPGGIDFWGVIGGLPTGSNTVSVTFTGGAGNVTTGASISLTGASSFGTAFTAFASATSVSVNVTGTTTGGMIVAAASFGNSSGSFTATAGTQRWSVIGDSNGAADNTVGGTWASPGGTQAVGFSETGAPADFWGLVAVEVQGGAAAAAGGGGGAAQPGRTWLRRFHHRQLLPQTPVTPAAVAAVPAPLGRPSFPRRLPQRARLGAGGALAAGILATGIGPPAVRAPHQPPAIAHPSPHRAQWRGGQGTAPAAPRQPFTPPRFAPRIPHRALWDGIAGSAPNARQQAHVPPVSAPRIPHRALWRGGAGAAPAVVVSTGAAQPTRPTAVYRRAVHGALWRSGAGAPPAPRPQPFRPVTVYVRAAHRVLWRGGAGPAVTVTPGTGAPQPFRPATVYRRTPHGVLWRTAAGQAPAARPQPFRPATIWSRPSRRALWRGGSGPAVAVTPGTGTPQPFRPLTVFRRAAHGALWRAITGTPPAATRQPFRPVTVFSRARHRAAWQQSRGTPPAARKQPSRPVTIFPRARHRALWRGGSGPAAPPPSGLLAGTTAGPPQGRWAASLPVDRWAALQAASRWQAALPAPRYDAGNPEGRWQAGPPVKGRYSMRIITGSVEYIQFPVTGPNGVDVTTFPLECAIVTEAHGEPPPGDPAWTTGVWLNGLASALIDETVLGNGDYVVFGRLTATPEKPVVRSGRVRLGPAA